MIQSSVVKDEVIVTDMFCIFKVYTLVFRLKPVISKALFWHRFLQMSFEPYKTFDGAVPSVFGCS